MASQIFYLYPIPGGACKVRGLSCRPSESEKVPSLLLQPPLPPRAIRKLPTELEQCSHRTGLRHPRRSSEIALRSSVRRWRFLGAPPPSHVAVEINAKEEWRNNCPADFAAPLAVEEILQILEGSSRNFPLLGVTSWVVAVEVAGQRIHRSGGLAKILAKL